jgi:peptide/nickel transport system permease protein
MSAPTSTMSDVIDRSPMVTRGSLVRRRLLRDKRFLGGTIMLLLLFAAAYIGPYFSKWGYKQPDFKAFLKPPSSSHWFGTTQIGNDVFAQTMRGLQKSLLTGILVAMFSAVIASIIGLSAGYFRGAIDTALLWLIDLLLVLPSLLIIAIVSKRVARSSWIWLAVLLAIFSWMLTARLLRSMTLSLRELEYVKAAQFMGVSSRRIITRHLLPNVASLLIVDTTLTVAGAIIGESSLSFLGFGVQPPDVSLGSLIGAGAKATLTAPWLFLFATGLLIIAILSVNLIGDGLRDALDPTGRRS